MDDDDFDEVIKDAPQSPTTGSSQLSVGGQRSTSGLFHGFVRMTCGVVNTTFVDGFHSRIPTCAGDFGPGLVDTHPVCNEAGTFTVSPLLLCNIQTLII